MESAELAYRPSSLVPVDEGQAGKLMRLIDALEDNDDVSAVHANFDVACRGARARRRLMRRGAAGGDPLRRARHAPAGAHASEIPKPLVEIGGQADRVARDPPVRGPRASPLPAGDRLPGRADRALRRCAMRWPDGVQVQVLDTGADTRDRRRVADGRARSLAGESTRVRASPTPTGSPTSTSGAARLPHRATAAPRR